MRVIEARRNYRIQDCKGLLLVLERQEGGKQWAVSDINLKPDKQIPVHWENKEEDIGGRGTNSNIQQHCYEGLNSSNGSVGGFK